MNEVLTAILAIIGAFGAWKLRGFLADRTIRDLAEERDKAQAEAWQGGIKYEAKDIETNTMKAQQKTEAERHEKDSGGIAHELDGMFSKPK
jgi:hypothetical protein